MKDAPSGENGVVAETLVRRISLVPSDDDERKEILRRGKSGSRCPVDSVVVPLNAYSLVDKRTCADVSREQRRRDGVEFGLHVSLAQRT